MNTASPELCQELYELSGWDDKELETYSEFAHKTHIETDKMMVQIPAYNLGYLLRKLPAFVNSTSGRGYKLKLTANVTSSGDREATIGYEALRQVSRDQTAGFEFLHHPKIQFQHGTFENATCKLAIELIKAGVLKP